MFMLCLSRMDSFHRLRTAVIQMAIRFMMWRFGYKMMVIYQTCVHSLLIFSIRMTLPFFTQFPTEPIVLPEDSISTDWNAPSLLAIDLEDNASVNPVLWSVSIPPSHGDANFSNSADPASLVYVPVANYYGSDQFTIRIDDSNTTNATVERVLHISVTAINDAPTDNLPTSEILVPENTPIRT